MSRIHMGKNQALIKNAEQCAFFYWIPATVFNLLSPTELLDEYAADGQNLENGTLMFGGTCGVIGTIRHTTLFEFELNAPVFGRTIRHAYVVVPVPIHG